MATKRWYGPEDLEKRFGPLTFAQFLKSWRQCDEMSQTAFAKRLGISKANLCDIEKGRKKVSLKRAAKIADILGLPPAGIVEIALDDMMRDAGLTFRFTVSPSKKAA